jgi:hypothetical protein
VANLANRWLDLLRAIAFTAPAGTYVKLHTGDPGPAGLLLPSAVTTRSQATFSPAANALLTMNNVPAFSMTATENISHISVWDTVGPTGGNFLFSGVLTSPQAVVNTNTFSLNSLSVSLSPLAA